ncbi:MAG: ribonucleotide-diphosphate reductase subunit beta, partial [Hyphomicrobium sp.]
LAANELLEAKVWDAIDLGSDGKSSRKGEASWKLKSAATVYGFATWWSAELAPGIALSTAPDAPRTHWEQLYFPLLQPIASKAGETIGVNLRTRTSADAGTHVAWVATHRDAKGRETARQSLNLDKGFLP